MAIEIGNIHVEYHPCIGENELNNCANAAKPAILTIIAMKAAILFGEPSYTSGLQKWNGTAETLNNNPTETSISPALTKIGNSPKCSLNEVRNNIS